MLIHQRPVPPDTPYHLTPRTTWHPKPPHTTYHFTPRIAPILTYIAFCPSSTPAHSYPAPPRPTSHGSFLPYLNLPIPFNTSLHPHSTPPLTFPALPHLYYDPPSLLHSSNLVYLAPTPTLPHPLLTSPQPNPNSPHLNPTSTHITLPHPYLAPPHLTSLPRTPCTAANVNLSEMSAAVLEDNEVVDTREETQEACNALADIIARF